MALAAIGPESPDRQPLGEGTPVGVMIMVGLVLAASQAALGSLAASGGRTAVAVAQPVAGHVRGLAIIAAAFVEGIAVIAVVVAFLAIFMDEIGGVIEGTTVALLTLLGGVAGLAIAFRVDGPVDGTMRLLLVAFMGGIAVLGFTTAILTITLGGSPQSVALDDVVVAAVGGLVGALALVIGRIASHGLTSMTMVGADLRALQDRAIRRVTAVTLAAIAMEVIVLLSVVGLAS